MLILNMSLGPKTWPLDHISIHLMLILNVEIKMRDDFKNYDFNTSNVDIKPNWKDAIKNVGYSFQYI